LSSRNRKPVQPQREVGRQRVAELLDAAADVIQQRGLEAATMAEIAARADARIGSLYRFFPSKEAVADALVEHYTEVLQAEWDAIRARAAGARPEDVADVLIDLLVKLRPKTRAAAALLDSRMDPTELRTRFRSQALAGIKAALQACAPHLAEGEATDIAAVVLNNMKTMVGMIMKDAPTTPGAPDQLRLMNRLYLIAQLARRKPAG
jgi:AcrR family transcriptional regulator